MIHPKPPSPTPRPKASTASAAAPDAQTEKAANPAGRQRASRNAPAGSNSHDEVERIHTVHTPAGLLSLRDPERLRRYILEAPDEAQQECRQQALLEQSFRTLATWPERSSSNQCRVVNLGLLAWPVLVCYDHPLKIRPIFAFNGKASAPLRAELAALWAQVLGVNSAVIQLDGAFSVQRLAGLSPLMLQSRVHARSRWLASIVGQLRSDPTAPPARLALAAQVPEDPWDPAVLGDQELFMPMEPGLAAVFLLTAFVAWDYSETHPIFRDEQGRAAARMRELMAAVFTHGVKQTPETPGAALPASAPTVASPYVPRTPRTPTIRLGEVQPVHDAVTQGQWMQLAWMAERARKTGRQFKVSQSPQGSFLTWNASLGLERGEADATLSYTYDAFWRPLGHVQTIFDRVDLAQGTGQMPDEQMLRRLMH
jgi:hypothetical protein